MEVVRVLNNNLVLAKNESGSEVIVTGWGVGFHARPGQPVDSSKVNRTFLPSDGRDPDYLGKLLADIPTEQIHLVTQALTDAGVGAAANSPTLVIALADHLTFAVQRQQMGMQLDYPLVAEVKHLYADEYRQARAVLTALNSRLSSPLPEDEAVAIALHMVNAGFATGDLSFTYTMTGVIQQMIEVIQTAYGITLDADSVSVGRLITHLRYLFVRIHQHKQIADQQFSMGTTVRESYPQALECAERLAQIIELRLDDSLTGDEVSYLTLHVARVVEDRAT